jgi:hypothetical protein
MTIKGFLLSLEEEGRVRVKNKLSPSSFPISRDSPPRGEGTNGVLPFERVYICKTSGKVDREKRFFGIPICW